MTRRVKRVRDTSLEAWEDIAHLLPTARRQVYTELAQHGPQTGAELDDRFRSRGMSRDPHKRLSELVKMGVVRELCPRTCRITGRTSYEYDAIVGVTPIPLRPARRTSKPSNREIADALNVMRKCIPEDDRTPELVKVGKWLAELAGVR